MEAVLRVQQSGHPLVTAPTGTDAGLVLALIVLVLMAATVTSVTRRWWQVHVRGGPTLIDETERWLRDH